MNKNTMNKNITTKFLPEDLHSELVGLLLSDGGIYRTSKTSNCRYEMSFGTRYRQFAESIGNLLKDYMKNPVKEVQVKGANKVYTNYRLKTMTLPIFNIYHEIFYVYNDLTNKYVKIVPDLILDLMNPIVLAYLIMGDGNYDTLRNRVRIYTNSFSKEDVVKLQKAINQNLGIVVGVLHDRKDQWILTIGAKQIPKLQQLVSPYFEPSMLYRINM
jgi:hypothetical protein